MAAAEAGATMTITFRPTCDLYDAHPDAARVPSVSWQNLGGGSHRCALVGDVLAGQAQRNGWAGIVVFGCVRDKAALGGLALGVMALGVIPRKSVRRGEGRVDIPIRLADAGCRPGDAVYCDDDGVVFLDAP